MYQSSLLNGAVSALGSCNAAGAAGGTARISAPHLQLSAKLEKLSEDDLNFMQL